MVSEVHDRLIKLQIKKAKGILVICRSQGSQDMFEFKYGSCL